MASMLRTLVLLCALILLAGCVSFDQESDWRWKQYNPDYRPLYPRPYESGWTL